MIKVAISDILDGKLDDLNTFEHYIYVVRDADIVLYVGQAIDPVDRLKGHCRQGEWGWASEASRLGQLILNNPDVVQGGHVELMTVANCESFIRQHCPECVLRNVTIAELALIRAFRPALNIAHNWDPIPLPERYRDASPTDSSSRGEHAKKRAARLLHVPYRAVS